MTALCATAGSLLGNYAGKVLTSLYAKGGSFASATNKVLAKVIAKYTKASISSAKGNGWTLKLKQYTVRIMTTSKRNTNYLRISMAGKGTMDLNGKLINGRTGAAHIGITIKNLIKLIKLMRSW